MKWLCGAAFVPTAILISGCGGGDDAVGGSGFVEATEVLVSSEASGRLQSVRFDEGDTVRVADTLAVIDPSKLELELNSLRALRQTNVASLEVTRLQLERTREQESFSRSERDRVVRLVRSGTATEKQRDQLDHDLAQAINARNAAQASIDVSKAQIAKIDADIEKLIRQLEDCHPLSPKAGIVVEKYVEAGELVAPGKALLKIAQLDTVWVKIYLPAGTFAAVKLGQRAEVSTESGGTKYVGNVTWTSQEAEFTPKNIQTEKSRANLVFAVKVTLPNSDGTLKIGMPVFVTLEK